MALTNMLMAVALCTLGHSEAFSLRKVAEGLTNRQLRRTDDLVLPTVSPGLNPGDAGVQEWPSEFKPDIMSAFELLKSKRAAAPEEGEGQGQPGPTFPFTGGFGNYLNPITSLGSGFTNMSSVSEFGQQFIPNGNNSGNPFESYNPMNQMGNLTSNFPQVGSLPSGISQMGNLTSVNPLGSYVGGDQLSQLNGITNMTNQYTGSIPFMNNNNNKPEGDKESKRSIDCSR